jgi:hypothetical protein
MIAWLRLLMAIVKAAYYTEPLTLGTLLAMV